MDVKMTGGHSHAGKACKERNLATVNTHADWTVHGASQVLPLSQTQDTYTGDICSRGSVVNKWILFKKVF